MENKNKSKRLLAMFSLIVGTSLTLTSCSFFPLPDPLRYQKINNIVDAVDYKTAGEVSKERYDRGDGVSSESFFRAEILGGHKTYEALKKDILQIDDVECHPLNADGYIECKVGQVDIYVNLIDEEEPSYVIFKVTDVYSGREVK